MAEFRYTLGQNYDPNSYVLGYQESINLGATSLDFGPGTSVEGFEDSGIQLVYAVNGSNIAPEFQVFPLTTQIVGLYGDSSDFDGVTRVTGGDFGDVFRTGDGDDVLKGGGGNDTLEGGRGTNTFDGGAGTNTLSYEHFDTSAGSFGMIIDLSTGQATDWSTGTAVVDTFSNISNVRGSVRKDGITGDDNGNVIEGGAGDDELVGGGGVDTLSYAHSGGSVNIDLVREFGIGGDAEDDRFTSFESVIGSTFGDTLYGDGGANTLNGNGGSDELYGRDGNDRLVISDSPMKVEGGEGTDLLFILKDSTVELNVESFSVDASIEKVYVRDGAYLSMSGVAVGTKLYSQSQTGGNATIIGTNGADRIQAGKGDDGITGGKGGDALFGGAGADTFVFAAGDGRDVIRKFDALNDKIDLSSLGGDTGGLDVRSFHGGDSTLITLTHESGPTDKIILIDVGFGALSEGSFIL
ncbi:calcium-binding protein [Methylobacterium bullatum]|uniref:Bifunctional hemolysin/adenylate cyclase n=1 Tax=Methylobacterium bullatum TaxID=570505 RepID=A0A679JLQ3_9HYPH|nr:Bifunctional hemolysin/adenylate cyclase [Methylobacterium bullatum]